MCLRFVIFLEWTVLRFSAAEASFCTDGDEIWRGRLIHVKYMIHLCKVGSWAPNCNFLTKFRNINAPGGIHSVILTKFSILWAVSKSIIYGLNLVAIAEGVPQSWRFNPEGAFSPNFEHVLAAKLYVASGNVSSCTNGKDL